MYQGLQAPKKPTTQIKQERSLRTFPGSALGKALSNAHVAHLPLGHSELSGVGGGGRDLDGSISFGLGLARFDIPIAPDRAEIEAILKGRFQKLFLEKLGEAMRRKLRGGSVDAKQIAKDAWNDVLQAYIAGRRHRVLEDPGFRIHVEGR